MSKLNKAPKALSPFASRELGVSGNGNVQFVKAPLQSLFELVTSTIYGNDTLYEKSADKVARLKDALANVIKADGLAGADVAARMALFVRHKIGMRTMALIMGVELLSALRTAGLTFPHSRKFISLLIDRADELNDLYAYALTVFGTKGKVPLALKRGVADAFNKFDGYQLAKYNRTEGQVTLKRLLRIVHPTPINDVQSKLFDQLMRDTLPLPNTWEVRLSQNGMLPKGEQLSKADLWTELVTTRGPGEMGYMALIRNLRNIAQAGVSDETLAMVAARIRDPKAVERSRMLPWAFINAHEVAVQDNLPAVLRNAVSDAIELALGNMPSLGKRVWLIGDVSTSMQNGAGKNSPLKASAILMAALFKAQKQDVAITLFSNNAELLTGLNPRDSVTTLFGQIMKKSYGGGTNIASAFADKHRLGFEPDTVVVLSDMEVNRTTSKTAGHSYGHLSVVDKGVFAKDVLKIAINLNSSVTTPLDPRDGWLQLEGWSEKLFKYAELQRDGASILDQLIANTIEVVNVKKPREIAVMTDGADE